METLSVSLVAALVALNVIGGGILIRWLVKQVQALEGSAERKGPTGAMHDLRRTDRAREAVVRPKRTWRCEDSG